MSEVARGEKLRVAPSVEIRPGEVSTAAPSTIQVTAVCGAVSTDVLRVKSHVRLSVVPAYRVSVLLTVMDGVGTGTGGGHEKKDKAKTYSAPRVVIFSDCQ